MSSLYLSHSARPGGPVPGNGVQGSSRNLFTAPGSSRRMAVASGAPRDLAMSSARGNPRSTASTTAGHSDWGGTRGMCFQPETQMKKNNWHFVGNGNGGYEEVKQYNYVGEGMGSFAVEEEVVTYYSWRLRKCCLACFALLALLAGVFLLWRYLLPEGFSFKQLFPGSVQVGGPDIGANISSSLPPSQGMQCCPPGADEECTLPVCPAGAACAAVTGEDGICVPAGGNATEGDGLNGSAQTTFPLVPVTTTEAGSTTEEVSFDCDASIPRGERHWPEEQQQWCCKTFKRGCKRGTAPGPYDCEAGLKNAKEGWSPDKKTWCCTVYGAGCERSTTSPKYDCEHKYKDWRTEWPQEKQDWCCRFYGRACPPADTTPPPYDCTDGFDNWKEAWNSDKKFFCCKVYGRGCEGKLPKGGDTCGTPCVYKDATLTCEQRYQYSATHQFRGQPNACEKGRDQVQKECPVCLFCALEDAGCTPAADEEAA